MSDNNGTGAFMSLTDAHTAFRKTPSMTREQTLDLGEPCLYRETTWQILRKLARERYDELFDAWVKDSGILLDARDVPGGPIVDAGPGDTVYSAAPSALQRAKEYNCTVRLRHNTRTVPVHPFGDNPGTVSARFERLHPNR